MSYQISLHLNALLLLGVGLLSAFPQRGVDLLGGGLLGLDDRPGDHALGKTSAVVRNRLENEKSRVRFRPKYKHKARGAA